LIDHTTPASAPKEPALIDEHHDAVPSHHRFGPATFKGAVWDLSHLDAFALRVDLPVGPKPPVAVDVVVLFSCHCFTHEIAHDSRPASEIPSDEMFNDSRETRVLNEERYRLSRQLLGSIIRDLEKRHIQIADPTRPNFITVEVASPAAEPTVYAVFFEVQKDALRRKRLILRVQSAYVTSLTKRQRNSGKVTFIKLLSAAYERKRI
jgi:hypothetical protein